jgi:hypothetical protein
MPLTIPPVSSTRFFWQSSDVCSRYWLLPSTCKASITLSVQAEYVFVRLFVICVSENQNKHLLFMAKKKSKVQPITGHEDP